MLAYLGGNEDLCSSEFQMDSWWRTCLEYARDLVELALKPVTRYKGTIEINLTLKVGGKIFSLVGHIRRCSQGPLFALMRAHMHQ